MVSLKKKKKTSQLVKIVLQQCLQRLGELDVLFLFDV